MDVKKVSVFKLRDFSEVIFKPYEGERFNELVLSIDEYGIISPIIVRQLNDEYEILSGHERVRAAKEVGLSEIPCIDKGVLTDEEAQYIVTQSNVAQRGFMELSISERAHCLYVRHEAMKKQGFRTDLLEEVEIFANGNQGNVEELEQVASDDYNLKPRTVSRYVRIHMLVDELKPFVDSKAIKIKAAEILSFLTVEHQVLLADVVAENEFEVSESQANKLRKLEKEDEFVQDKVFLILYREEVADPVQFVVSRGIMEKFFKGFESEDAMEVIEQALEFWYEAHEEVRGNQAV